MGDVYFKNIYKNKKVLVTGHTGFKGSWLSMWLEYLGAEVYGISLHDYSFDNLTAYQMKNNCFIADIRDLADIRVKINKIKPDIVFHLAAQSLVQASYSDAINTFTTNVIGTSNLLEVCKEFDEVKSIIIITSDKCYKNNDSIWAYREIDSLGGDDPYSASKACAEIISHSYRSSFFSSENDFIKIISTLRAGNVIGGGDWSNDRLIPDMVRSIASNSYANIRNPESTRPWQHVLDCLSGYLLIGSHALAGNSVANDSFNFGPDQDSNIKVRSIVEKFSDMVPEFKFSINNNSYLNKEARLLNLDSTKAHVLLKWEPVWDINISLSATIDWYNAYLLNRNLISGVQLNKYLNDARKYNVIWTNDDY